MTLSCDERELLRMIAGSEKPVAMSDFFHTIHPPVFPVSAAEDDPDRVEWTALQMNLYRASITLWQNDLVQVVHPANGERPDLVKVTDNGRAALA